MFSALCLSPCIILAANRNRPCNLCLGVCVLVWLCLWMVFSLKNIAIYWIDARKSGPPTSCWIHTHIQIHKCTEVHSNSRDETWLLMSEDMCVCERERDRMLTLHCVIISNGLINTKIFRERVKRDREGGGRWSESREKLLCVVSACFCTFVCISVGSLRNVYSTLQQSICVKSFQFTDLSTYPLWFPASKSIIVRRVFR